MTLANAPLTKAKAASGNEIHTAFVAASISINTEERKRVLEQSCRLARLSACRSVCRYLQWVICGKTADWIWVQFVVVSGISRGTGVLYGDGDRRRKRDSFGGKCGESHCNQWEFCRVVILCRGGGDAALPKLLWDFSLRVIIIALCLSAQVTQETQLSPKDPCDVLRDTHPVIHKFNLKRLAIGE